MAPTETATEAKKIIDPLSGEELSQEDIDNEVTARVDALQFATKEEIEKALKVSKGATSTNFLKAFSGKEMPRLTAQEVRLIAATNGLTPPSVQINNLNKSGLFPNHNLKIEAETEQYSNNIVSRVLCNTRIALSQKPVDETTKKLHEELKAIQASLDPKDSTLTEFIVGQYLGMPLNHLALYTGMDEAEMSQSIERINLKLAETKAHIHVRNGIAILGTKDGAITIFNNEEARKNLFPPKKENGKTSSLETELSSALTALSAEREKTAAAELKATDLTQRLLEAEDIALQADGKAEQAQSKATSLETEKQTLVAQLELDIQESLKLSAEKAKVEADLKKLEKKLEDKTTELTASREEARAARGEARIAKASEENFKKQLEAARKQADEAEEARAAIMRSKGRGIDIPAARENANIQDLEARIRRGDQELTSLRQQLRRESVQVVIHPEELARLRRTSAELARALEKIRDLEAQKKPEQKDSPELAQLRTELAEKDEALAKIQQDLAKSSQQIAALTEELGIANELLESASNPAPAPIQNPAQAPAPKAPIPVATATAPSSAPTTHPPVPKEKTPLQLLNEGDFRDGSSLVTTVKKALVFACETNGAFAGQLSKKKIRDVRDALTQLSELNDWTKQTRNTLVQELAIMSKTADGGYLSEEKLQEFLAKADSFAIN